MAALAKSNVEVGASLVVELPDQIRACPRSASVRVVHSAVTEIGWIIGGAFHEPLSHEQVLSSLMPLPQPGIMVVEEDEPVRQMLGLLLQEYGFAVYSAASGRQALEAYPRYRTSLVLLDVGMVNMDGPAILAELERLDPGVCCWFMTGGASKYSDEDLLRRGAAGVIHKPFVVAELTPALCALVSTMHQPKV